MHIPDGFISPGLSAGLVGASAVTLGCSISRLRSAFTAKVPVRAMSTGICTVTSGARRVLTSSGEKAVYKMGMVAALVFAAQTLNFPVDSGTSGHLIGGVLAAVLLGPLCVWKSRKAKMKKAFLFVPAVAVIAAFFASSSPDGLERVAGNLGFIDSAAERESLLADYSVSALPEGGLSAASAGTAGVLITLSVFWIAAFWLKRSSQTRS